MRKTRHPCQPNCPELVACLSRSVNTPITITLCSECQGFVKLVRGLSLDGTHLHKHAHLIGIQEAYRTRIPEMLLRANFAESICPNATNILIVDQCIDCLTRLAAD
jgi:hypothetical protein